MATINRTLTDDSIKNEWNLENWNDITQTYKTKMKNCET